MDIPDSDKTTVSPLWEAMVWDCDYTPKQSTSENALHRVEGLLRNGHDANEIWHHSSWVRVKRPGGCVVPTYSSADLEYRSSPLFSAILDNNTELTILLLRHGADTERRTKQGMTALHLAVKLMKRDFVKLLVGYGANLEAITIDQESKRIVAGCFASHYAVLSARLDILRDLLELGANFQVTTTAGWSILDIAILYQRVDIIDYLANEYPLLLTPFADHSTCTDVIQSDKYRRIAHQLLSTGARDTNKQHKGVFNDCMKWAWDHIKCITSSTTGVGRIILKEAETALIAMAGLNDQLSWDPGFCKRCLVWMQREIHLLSKPFEHSPDISWLQQSALSGCSLCQVLSEIVQSDFQRHSQQYSRSWRSAISRREDSADGPTVKLKVEFPKEYCGWFNGDDLGALIVQCNQKTRIIDLGLVDEQTRIAIFNTGPNDVHGSRSDRSLAVARAWLEHCELSHSKCRIEPLPELPARVIAVGNEEKAPRLHCSTKTRARYAVLSYCWGGLGNIQTTAANLSRHLDAIQFQELPKTIQDAIIITRGIGIEYLWIDSLCIVQDSTEDFKQQAALMGDIYAHATLTIAAKDASNASIGCLSDIERKSTAILPLNFLFPRGPGGEPHRSPRINKAMLIPRLDVPPKETGKVALDYRGWTLQEQLLSRRILNCGKQELSWSCLERDCSESQPRTSPAFLTQQNDNAFTTRLSMAKKSYDYKKALVGDELFNQWLKVVEDYSNRQLSDPKDKVVALAGLQSRFADILHDTPLLGGWSEHYLWPSLLWYCPSPEKRGSTQEISYPSWAWPSAASPISFMTRGLGQNDSFDPEIISWNLNVVEEDVKIDGSVRIKCRLLPGSVFNVDEADFNDRDELTFGFLAIQQRVIQEAMDRYDAEQQGTLAEFDEAILRKEKAIKASNAYHFMLIANIPWSALPTYGYPANPGGMPASALFMILEKTSPDQMHFRKVALYQEWESDEWRDKLETAMIELF